MHTCAHLRLLLGYVRVQKIPRPGGPCMREGGSGAGSKVLPAPFLILFHCGTFCSCCCCYLYEIYIYALRHPSVVSVVVHLSFFPHCTSLEAPFLRQPQVPPHEVPDAEPFIDAFLLHQIHRGLDGGAREADHGGAGLCAMQWHRVGLRGPVQVGGFLGGRPPRPRPHRGIRYALTVNRSFRPSTQRRRSSSSPSCSSFQLETHTSSACTSRPWLAASLERLMVGPSR